MSRVIPFPNSLTRELCRLMAVEQTARAQNDVASLVHSRLRWCELVITQCPGLAAAAPQVARRVAALLPTPSAPVPRWKLELIARPLVPIVRRKITSTTSDTGGCYQTAVEVLACGHSHELLIVTDSDRRARRRRCRKCGAARLAATAAQVAARGHGG